MLILHAADDAIQMSLPLILRCAAFHCCCRFDDAAMLFATLIRYDAALLTPVFTYYFHTMPPYYYADTAIDDVSPSAPPTMPLMIRHCRHISLICYDFR